MRIESFELIRANVKKQLKLAAKKHDKSGLLVLDIAPQIHEGAKHYFKKSVVETLDIDPRSNPTHVADITQHNRNLRSKRYDIIVCTEVLEHTLNPFYAITEIYRLLKKGGILLLTVPFNFRIHGPLPDCWRFTEHGLKELLKKFSSLTLEEMRTPKAFSSAWKKVYMKLLLLPLVQHSKILKCKKTNPLKLNIGCGTVKFPGWINIDIETNADLVLDIRRGLPFDNNSVDFIYCEHFIEHISYKEGTSV